MSYKPKKNAKYWMINSRWKVKQGVNGGAQKSKDRIAAGNSFKTQKEAQIFATQIKNHRFEQLHPLRTFIKKLRG